MSLSIHDVNRIAHLARIRVSADEALDYQDKLNGIFGLIEALQSVDTAEVKPMAHGQEVFQRLREDRAVEPDRREAFQAVAPQVEQGLYLVPKVIE